MMQPMKSNVRKSGTMAASNFLNLSGDPQKNSNGQSGWNGKGILK